MILRLTSTSKVVTIHGPDGAMPARIWQGVTGNGVPVLAFITRLAVEHDQDTAEFEAELQEQHAPATGDVAAWPSRMFID